jgi:hypothetical protein
MRMAATVEFSSIWITPAPGVDDLASRTLLLGYMSSRSEVRDATRVETRVTQGETDIEAICPVEIRRGLKIDVEIDVKIDLKINM